jgi:hypothetical protein
LFYEGSHKAKPGNINTSIMPKAKINTNGITLLMIKESGSLTIPLTVNMLSFTCGVISAVSISIINIAPKVILSISRAGSTGAMTGTVKTVIDPMYKD